MSEIRKQLTMKAASEIFKLAARLNIKPKDIIGMGGDIVKMGQSLFTEKVNPKLLKFVQNKGDVPPKILEEIKIHIRSLKNASDNQIELFKLNLKDIVNAKFPPANVVKLDISSKLPVAGIKRPGSLADEMAAVESQMGNIKKTSSKLDDAMTEYKNIYKAKGPEFGSREYYLSEIKKTGKTVDTTNKTVDELKEILYRLDTEGIPFNSGGVAKFNAELNQLPEYYLPLAAGGRARYSFGEGPVMEETDNMDFLSSLTQEEVDADPERYAQLLIGLRKPDFFMGEGDSLRAYFRQPDGGSISVPWGFKGYGLSYDQTIDFKTGGIANHFRNK